MTAGRRPGARGEDGSMLIIALVFITVFFTLLAAVLTFTDVGLRSSRAFSAEGRATYGTDAAMQSAIYRYAQGGACENVDSPSAPDGTPVDGGRYTVGCTGPPPGGDRASRPLNALLSLGNVPGEKGIETTAGMRVLGSLFSNTTVHAGASLVVQGQVAALGNCDGPIATDPAGDVHCANSTPPADQVDRSRGRDPDYTMRSSTVPLHRDVPFTLNPDNSRNYCPTSGWLVTLDPGAYDNADGLSKATSCPGVVVWFRPGFYYFDFTFRGGTPTWTMSEASADVVAGQPKGWRPGQADRPSATELRVPGACLTETDGSDVEGVQMVFGGESRLEVDKGRFEACATPSRTEQSIALYGMAPHGTTHVLGPTAVPAHPGFDLPGNALVIGETPALAATAGLTTDAPTAQMVFTGFRPGVPPGALIDSVKLLVSHREGNADVSLTPAVTFNGAAGGSCTLPAVPANTGGTFVVDPIELKAACGLKDAAAFPDLQVRVDAKLAAPTTTGDEALDGVSLEVAYRLPTTMRAAAVTAAAGFSNAGNALEIEGAATADAALSDTGTTSASLTVAGLGDPPIPPGSSIDSAQLRVVHHDAGALAQPTVTVPFAGGTCTAVKLPLSPSAFADDRVDLKACGLDDAAKLRGLTATFDVALAAGAPPPVTGTESLDGMWLELVYRPPAATRTAATVTPTGTFIGQDNAKVIGEAQTADAILNDANPTASLAFAGYENPPVPAGSYIESAVLRVAHRDDTVAQPTITVPFPGGTCSATLRLLGALDTDAVDLRKDCNLTDPALLTGMVVTYTVNQAAPGASGTDSVDGVVLDLVYRPPTTRRPGTATATLFANPDNAKAIDGATATAGLGSAGPVGTATLGAFDQLPIPAGSRIDSARLNVAHQDDDGIASVGLTTSFPGNTCTAMQPLPRHAGLATDRSVDLTTCGLNDPAQLTGPGGLSATYAASLPLPTSATQTPTTTGSVSGFSNADAGRAIDGTTATASLIAGLGESASITLSGYDTPALPAGSFVDSAVLRIAHQDENDTVPITVSFPGSSCTTQTVPTHPNTLGEYSIDLKAACGLTDPAALAGLSVKYTVALQPGGGLATYYLDGAVVDIAYRPPATDRLDGVELEVVYEPPVMRPLGGCLDGAAGAYPTSPGACALVKVVPVDPAVRFAVAGTVYAPSAPVHVEMKNVTAEMITRGIIGRTIRIGIAPDPRNQRPTIGIPPEAVSFLAFHQNTLHPDHASSVAGSGAAAYAPTSAVTAIDKAEATATLDTTASPPQTQAVLGVDWLGAQPITDPADVDLMVLRVAHREDQDIGAVTVGISKDGAPCQPTVTLSPHPFPQPVTDQVPVDITAAGCGVDPSRLSVSLKVTTAVGPGPLPATVKAYVDGITLDVLNAPVLRADVVFDRGSSTVNTWTALR